MTLLPIFIPLFTLFCGALLRRAVPADLILLDPTMPGEHGLALVGVISKTSNAGVIILTGTGDAVDRVAGLELGADPAKPRRIKTVRGAGYVFTAKVTRR